MNILERYSSNEQLSFLTKILVFAISATCVIPVNAQSIKNSSDYNIFTNKFKFSSVYLCRKFKCTFSHDVGNAFEFFDIGRKNSNPKILFTTAFNRNKIESISLIFDKSRYLTLSESETNEQLYRIFGVRKVWVLYCNSPYQGEDIYLRDKIRFVCNESPKQISYIVGPG